MIECENCLSRVPSTQAFRLGSIEIDNCVECGRLIGASSCTDVVGMLSGMLRDVTPDESSSNLKAPTHPCIYLIVPSESAAASLHDELAEVEGIEFRIFAEMSAGMTQFVSDTAAGAKRKLVVFHPATQDGVGTPFIYGVRAVEMGFAQPQVPVLVLGDKSCASLDRCIAESKNARFVSIGTPQTEVELVKRYLNVIDKLAKR
jgi:hypothetical protein